MRTRMTFALRLVYTYDLVLADRPRLMLKVNFSFPPKIADKKSQVQTDLH